MLFSFKRTIHITLELGLRLSCVAPAADGTF